MPLSQRYLDLSEVPSAIPLEQVYFWLNDVSVYLDRLCAPPGFEYEWNSHGWTVYGAETPELDAVIATVLAYAQAWTPEPEPDDPLLSRHQAREEPADRFRPLLEKCQQGADYASIMLEMHRVREERNPRKKEEQEETPTSPRVQLYPLILPEEPE